jgi:hypothetical protein
MANTWGGLIIIGIKDKDSKPELPIKGLEFKEHYREQINNIILGNITPPVFPEIQICENENDKRILIIVRVPQSNMTPHAIRRNTRVYLRTETSNEPEELADIDKVLWLVNKRGKSIELKNSFYERSDSRVRKLVNDQNPIKHGDQILSASPLYPFKVFIGYDKLLNDIIEKISVRYQDIRFPYNYGYSQYDSIQYGSYSLIHNKEDGFISYEELNHFGFLYQRVKIAMTDGTGAHICYLIRMLKLLYAFILSVKKYYSFIGYWGYIDLRLDLNNIGDVKFIDLPPVRGLHKFDFINKTPPDNHLVFLREILFKDLEENTEQIVIGIFTEMTWALGFSRINETGVRELLQKGW